MPESLERIVGRELEPSEIHLLIYDQRGERQAAAFRLIFGGDSCPASPAPQHGPGSRLRNF